ncbi:MAG: hypothetical protein H0U35_01805 [Sporichthyaceae bacterium]|nr:hypothetical protein [Sporichthyaceae bacterium]
MAVSWHSFDLVSGRRGARLVTESLGTVKRHINEANDVTVPVRMFDHERGRPFPGWLEGTNHGLTMLVAIDTTDHDEDILWGGMVVRRIRTIGPTANVSAVTLEHYFGRRYVGDVAWDNVDLAQIAADVVDSISDDGIGLTVATTPTGVMLGGEYSDSEDMRVAAILDTLAALDGGIEFTVELGWANAEHTALTKTLRIGPRIGLAPLVPTVWSYPGCVDDFEFVEDFTTEYGANDVTTVSSGEGDSRPSERRTDEALIAGGYPRYEKRDTPGTSITRETTLESAADAMLADMRLGLTQLTIKADARTAPRFGRDWFLGDDLLGQLSCDAFPPVMGPEGYVVPGFNRRLRAVGVELDLDGHKVNPITQEVDA